jgi:hypothetical protein
MSNRSTVNAPVKEIISRRGWRRIVLPILLALVALLGVLLASFLSGQPASAETKLAENVAKELIAACPLADPADKNAREVCGQKLSTSKLLIDSTSMPVLWGVVQQVGNYNLQSNRSTTRFHPMVMWKVYLSVFMFTGKYSIEKVGDQASGYQQTIIHMPYQYRNKLDMGEYPYPYWHSKKKWDAFQYSPEVDVIIEKGKVAAVFRSAKRDRSRPYVNHEWDGRWRWTGANGEQEPRVTLFEYLFSKSNPHIPELDKTFRALDTESRKYACQTCHNPGNPSHGAPLGIMEYPNQALSIRHRIVKVMELNRMPPSGVVTKNGHADITPAGIANEAERQKYLKMARAFAETGDKALAYEGQRVN